MRGRRNKAGRFTLGGGGERGVAEEDGGGVLRHGEGLAGGERHEGGARDAERAAVVGVGGRQVVAGVDCLLDEAAPLLAPPHGVLVVQLGRRATHFSTCTTLFSIFV